MQTYNRLMLMVLLILLTACTTTRTSFTTPYSTAEKDEVTDEFDKEKAARTRLSLGLRYLRQSDYEKAKFNLDKAQKHLPNNGDVLRGFAWYFEKVSEAKLAQQYYDKAMKIDPKNPALLNQYGVFLCRNNQLSKSLKMFEASAKNLSNNDVSGTYENAATCNLMAGNSKEAEGFYRQALNHNPRQWASLLGMATIEFDKGRYSRSHSYISRYEKIAQHSPRSLWLALRTESNLGNKDGAASYALKLEQLFPDSQQTADYLDTKRQWLK